MDKKKTTQQSGLTDYELELELVVTRIRFADSTIESIKILEKYVDSIFNEEIRESEESSHFHHWSMPDKHGDQHCIINGCTAWRYKM